MKKKVCMLLAIITAVSVAGCGNPSSVKNPLPSGDKENTDSADTQRSGEKASTDETENSQTADNTADATGDNTGSALTDEEIEQAAKDFLGLEDADVLPVYAIDSDYYYQTSDDGTYTQIYDGERESVILSLDSAKKFPLLNKVLTEQAKKEKEEFKKIADSEMEEAKSFYADGFLYGPYTDTQDLKIQRTDDTVLSYYKDMYFFTGGAHGDYTIAAKTFEVDTGTELKLTDVIKTDDDTLKGILTKKIYETNENLGSDNYNDTFNSVEDNLKGYEMGLTESREDKTSGAYQFPYTWYLTNEGITFYFDVYTFGSYADGATQVSIGYNEMPELFDSKYLPKEGNGFMVDIGMPYETKMDIDGDNEMEVVTINYIYDNNDYEYATGVKLKIDDQEIETRPDYFYSEDGIEVYHVRTSDNRNYIYMMSGGLDDFYDWTIFDVNSDKPFHVGDVGFIKTYEVRDDIQNSVGIVNTNPDRMQFSERSDAMGTNIVSTTWHVGNDGMPVANDIRRKVHYYGDGVTIIGDFPVDVINYDGTVVSPGTFMPQGTKIYPIFTDLETYVDCKTDDGRYIRIYYTSMGYPATIDNTPVDDLLEGLMYAG